MSMMEEAHALMEAQRPGWFRETLELVAGNEGVVFVDADLFFAGIPDRNEPSILIVLMVVGKLARLRELAGILRGFKYAVWQREVKGDREWRKIEIEKFLTFKRFK